MNFVLLFVFLVVNMLVNTSLILFKLSWLSMVFFTKAPMHTPYQNGVTKYKNRKPYSNYSNSFTSWLCSQQFCSDVLSVLYCHSIVFPRQLFHPLTPLVFETTYFVHNLSLEVNKLSLKSHKCHFRIHNSKKGYKYFSPAICHYFITLHETFW